MNRLKKGAAILCIATMSASVLAGCGSSNQATIENANDVLFTYNGEDVTLKEAYIYAKMTATNYNQSYSTYFGENFWTMEVEQGKTMEASVKESVVNQIKRVIVLDKKAEEKKFSLTEEEKKDCAKYAKAFAKTNEGKEILEAAGANTEDMQTIYEDNALASKMQVEAVKKVDKKVSDEEARKTTITRVVFATTKTEDGNTVDMTEKEKAEVKEKAEAALKKIKEGKSTIEKIAEDESYTNTSETYGEGEAEEGEDFEKAMAKVKNGELLDKVMKCSNGYVIAKMKAYTDKDATEAAKEEVVKQRQQDEFAKVYADWTDELEKDWDYEKSVNQTLWAEVVLRNEDSTATESVEETTAAESTTEGK